MGLDSVVIRALTYAGIDVVITTNYKGRELCRNFRISDILPLD